MLNSDQFLSPSSPSRFSPNNHPFKIKTGKGRADLAPPSLVSLRKAVSALRTKKSGGVYQNKSGVKLVNGRGVSRPEFSSALSKQRVVVKARVVVNKPGAAAKSALQEHIEYLERDEVGPNNEKGVLFDNDKDYGKDEVGEFLEKCSNDRHYFRLMISPEHGSRLDLKDFANDFMDQVSTDLGTRVEWVGVAHHNTDDPHVHIIVRGKDERGADLVINRDYMSNGFRQVSQNIATQYLGPRLESELEQERVKNITADRLTPLDRSLIKIAHGNDNSLINMRSDKTFAKYNSAEDLSYKVGRLQYLSGLGLAEEIDTGMWRIDSSLETRLKNLGEKNDIIKRFNKQFGDRYKNIDLVVFNKESYIGNELVGEIVDKGFVDEINDRKYITVMAADGKTYYTALNRFNEKSYDSVRIGAVVGLSVKERALVSKADLNIEESANKNGGIFDPEKHMQAAVKSGRIPKHADAEGYKAAHIKRAESLLRRGFIGKGAGETYTIPYNMIDNIIDKASNFRDSGSYLNVTSYSNLTLKAQMSAVGPTWLDKQLLDPNNEYSLRSYRESSRFSKHVKAALRGRLIYLRNRGLVAGNTLTKQGFVELYEQELNNKALLLEGKHGISQNLKPFTSLTGRVEEIVELQSGPHAVVKSGKYFSLVPAQKGLSKHVGKEVSISIGSPGFKDKDIHLAPQLSVRYKVLDRSIGIKPPSLGR